MVTSEDNDDSGKEEKTATVQVSHVSGVSHVTLLSDFSTVLQA